MLGSFSLGTSHAVVREASLRNLRKIVLLGTVLGCSRCRKPLIEQELLRLAKGIRSHVEIDGSSGGWMKLMRHAGTIP
ncbi:Hypothetical protein DEACI_1250 [Acididesulfobacillus acetoxydans]|uniref:Uncharacterized protein n=1 Tax=Acididesulfobacillus acetoxydans TaxID=1561005 RepID=A0A8S0XVU2_9FIRM|nr:Hypothetical protein DEACI_1250 [Acididesulfobacillus acetoxydans]CEJ09378.1 Hypothetical protein DEACI_3862 [Acididesulfobacillus acetoxydans]